MHPVPKPCPFWAVPPGYAPCPHRVPPGCAPCPQDATLGCALCPLRAPCATPCPPCAHGMHPPSSITQEGWAQGAYQRCAPWMHPLDTTCTSTMCLSEHPWMCPVPSCSAHRVPYAPGCALHPTVHPRMLSGSPLGCAPCLGMHPRTCSVPGDVLHPPAVCPRSLLSALGCVTHPRTRAEMPLGCAVHPLLCPRMCPGLFCAPQLCAEGCSPPPSPASPQSFPHWSTHGVLWVPAPSQQGWWGAGREGTRCQDPPGHPWASWGLLPGATVALPCSQGQPEPHPPWLPKVRAARGVNHCPEQPGLTWVLKAVPFPELFSSH